MKRYCDQIFRKNLQNVNFLGNKLRRCEESVSKQDASNFLLRETIGIEAIQRGKIFPHRQLSRSIVLSSIER